MVDIFDEGALERERQQKIEFQRNKYAAWAGSFLDRVSRFVESWPVYRAQDGKIRCDYENCEMAIDREGSKDAIRFHLFQVHRHTIGVEESGEYGENAALDNRGGNHGDGSGSGDPD